MKILIGEISSYKAIVLCRFISRYYREVEIITYDYKPFTRFIRTRYSNRHFVLDGSDRIKELGRLINNEKIDCFIPVMSSEMEKVIENRSLFGDSLNYVGNLESYRTLHYKDKLMQLASRLNVRIPVQYNSLEQAVSPFIIKPVNGSSAAGVEYILDDSRKTVLNNVDTGKMVIQEYIKGFGAGYSLFARNGKIITGYGHRRLAEYPVSGGSSVYRAPFVNNEMINSARIIIETLRWSGFCMLEYKITDLGQAYLIEANPRVWGSIFQGMANGVNYFEALLGTPDVKIKHDFDRNTYLSPLIYASLFNYIIKGDYGKAYSFLSDMHKKADVSLFTDPSAYINLIAKKNIFRHQKQN